MNVDVRTNPGFGWRDDGAVQRVANRIIRRWEQRYIDSQTKGTQQEAVIQYQAKAYSDTLRGGVRPRHHLQRVIYPGNSLRARQRPSAGERAIRMDRTTFVMGTEP